MKNLKPLIVSQSDISGGGPRAANRLHHSLVNTNIDSTMRVNSKQSDDWRVFSSHGKLDKFFSKLYPVMDQATTKLQHTNNLVLHSPCRFSSLKAAEINVSDIDVVNLHWIGSGFLSVEELTRIRKPIVWTLHDMWAFCGAEHYAPDQDNTRWREGYTKNNRDSMHSGFDIDRWTWRRKKKAWNNPFHINCPSKWLADCAANSELMHDWPISVIPNPLDTDRFKPFPKKLAREILGLPIDAKLVLFGAIGGGSDPRKGWDLLQDALSQLVGKLDNLNAVIFGQSEPKILPQLKLPLHWMGHLHDDTTLALLYSAVDATIVPSRQENLPQSGTEAQACGCPVIAFNTTGLSDVVEHKVTGYLAEPFCTEDLANGIEWVIEDTTRHQKLIINAREHAVKLWSQDVVIPQYLELYQSAIESKM